MIATLHRMGSARLAYVLFLALSLLGVRGSVNAQEPAATPGPISSLSAEDSIAAATASDGVLRFEVAEDGTHFVFDPDLTDGNGMPSYGTSFLRETSWSRRSLRIPTTPMLRSTGSSRPIRVL